MTNAQSSPGEQMSLPEVSSEALAASQDNSIAVLSLVRGVILLVIGITLLVWPKATIGVASVLVGIGLLAAGVTRFVGLFTAKETPWMKVLEGMLGILMVMAGVVCIRHPFSSLVVLVVIVALGWLLDGFASVVGAIHPFHLGRLLYGLLALAGVVAVLVWPGLVLATYLILAAWLLVLLGVMQIFDAWRSRRNQGVPATA
jgi:uncharacterized membrane protein HdeD (DUF308 family)